MRLGKTVPNMECTISRLWIGELGSTDKEIPAPLGTFGCSLQDANRSVEVHEYVVAPAALPALKSGSVNNPRKVLVFIDVSICAQSVQHEGPEGINGPPHLGVEFSARGGRGGVEWVGKAYPLFSTEMP